MTDEPDDIAAPNTATRILAELVAKRRAAAAFRGGPGSAREPERTAAARSAAKSKPAPRK